MESCAVIECDMMDTEDKKNRNPPRDGEDKDLQHEAEEIKEML